MLNSSTSFSVGKLCSVCVLVRDFYTNTVGFIFGVFTSTKFVPVFTTDELVVFHRCFVRFTDGFLKLPTLPTGPIRTTSYINNFIINALEKL